MPIQTAKEYIRFKANPNLSMFTMLEQIRKDALILIAQLAQKEAEKLIYALVEETRKDIEQMRQDEGVGSPKDIAIESAKAEIRGFKQETNDHIRIILKGLDEKKQEVMSMFESHVGQIWEQFSNLQGKNEQKISNLSMRIKKEISHELDVMKTTVSLIKPEKGDKGDKPVVGIDYDHPKDGSPDTPLEISDKLNTLTEKIDRSVIKGLEQWLKNIQQSLKQERKFGGAGGGGTTVKTPTEVPDSILTTFTVISQPIEVVADGITYFENNGYTYLQGKITMSIPPTNYIRYKV